VSGTLIFFLLLFLMRAMLRNQWLAAAAFVGLFTLIKTLGADHLAIEIPTAVTIYAICAVALVRFGLVTLAVAVYTADSIGSLPITMNPSAWYFGNIAFVMATVAALAVWSFLTATAGQKLFSPDLLE